MQDSSLLTRLLRLEYWAHTDGSNRNHCKYNQLFRLGFIIRFPPNMLIFSSLFSFPKIQPTHEGGIAAISDLTTFTTTPTRVLPTDEPAKLSFRSRYEELPSSLPTFDIAIKYQDRALWVPLRWFAVRKFNKLSTSIFWLLVTLRILPEPLV